MREAWQEEHEERIQQASGRTSIPKQWIAVQNYGYFSDEQC